MKFWVEETKEGGKEGAVSSTFSGSEARERREGPTLRLDMLRVG